MVKFGFSSAQWAQAKTEGKRILEHCAKRGKDISYSDFAAKLQAVQLEAHDARLFTLLGEISQDEHKEGRPLLSVLVIHKTGDKQPGPGFFEMAQGLDYDTSDPIVFWIAERKRVEDHWKRQ